VHRLDRPVGGAMVFAKTSKAASRLSDSIRRRDFDKMYWSVVHDVPTQTEATLTDWLHKNEQTNIVQVVRRDHPQAKEARLSYRILQSDPAGTCSLLEVDLHTGRPHQIRVQLAHSGHPIVGDHRYGTAEDRHRPIPLALWAVELGFPHPISKEWMFFRSSPPKREPWNRFRLE
jgi:23S rRNA pseudouridine1911/1915/1917 synthase